MKARNNDEISIVTRKNKASGEKAESKRAKPQVIAEKPRVSLASKISSSYGRMFITWMSIFYVVVLFTMVLFNAITIANDARPHTERVTALSTQEEMVSDVMSADTRLVLVDEEYHVLASSFGKETVKARKFFVGFETIGKSIFTTLSTKINFPDGRRLILLYYHDITLELTQLVLVAVIGLVVFVVAMAFLFFRGHMITRKAFAIVDEMVIKADNISSQNLNLRLNVSDSSDELVEFALTFNKMMDRIERSYEKQNQFVSDASHELRTPISVIQGYARMLERWGKDDKEILEESISAINKESKNMQDLVDKLLFIARNDKDSLVLVKEKFDLSSLVSELAKETKMLETGHEIRCFVDPNITLFGDPNRIKQALRIFADNALKYTPPDGAVTFRLEVEDGQAMVVVKDSGIGIPEKDLANIFDRFYRVDAARVRHQGGHGLGLSIARIIILRHGGRIKVASKENEGTRFSIFLPLDQHHEPPEAEHEHEASPKISPA